ncbi:MAG: hypothetical protein ABR599_09800 [Gemmatimonadota bacterium]
MHVSVILAALALGSGSAPDTTGESVVRRMHDRYAGRWPSNVTFVQKSTFYEGDSTRVETWYEAIEPGKLRIDVAPIENGNGLIFRNDSLYQFKADSMALAIPLVHPLMVLSRDVYDLPVERTLARLEGLGIDVSKVREDTWQGRPVYVVGAEAGDLKSPQFWVDRERLVFVRLLEPSQQDPSKTEETQFNEYQELGEGWIETEVVFLLDGERRMLEEYSEIREGVQFPRGLFDPAAWGPPAWVEG